MEGSRGTSELTNSVIGRRARRKASCACPWLARLPFPLAPGQVWTSCFVWPDHPPRAVCGSVVTLPVRRQQNFHRQAAFAGFPARAARQTHVSVINKLVLQPTGSGSCEHLDGEKVELPGPVVLREGTLDVGRVDPCDIVLPVPTVSSRHAILTVEGDKVLVIDVNSTNGTTINGNEIKAMDYVELPIGGEIVFGDEFLAKFTLQKVADETA